jgi:hypothetical protein
MRFHTLSLFRCQIRNRGIEITNFINLDTLLGNVKEATFHIQRSNYTQRRALYSALIT